MSLSLILIIFLGAVLTSLLSGIVGMAGDALFLVMLSFFFLPLQQSALLYTTAMFVACASRAFIHRKHVVLKSTEYYMVGLVFALFIFGSLPGLALDKASQDMLRGLGGLMLGVALFVPFFSQGKVRPDFGKPPQALIAGLLSNGFIKSIDSNGFLLNLFFQDIVLTRYQVIATKAVALLVPALLAFVAAVQMSSTASVPDEVFWACAAIVPAAILGSCLSQRILFRLSDVQFYAITRIILCVMGAVCIGSAALLLMKIFPEFLAPNKI